MTHKQSFQNFKIAKENKGNIMSNLYGKCIKELATLPEKQNELNKLQNNYNTSPKVMKLLSSVGESSSILYTYNKVAADRNNRIKELKKEIADISKQSFDLACKLEEKGQHEKAMALIRRLENYNGVLGNIDEIKLKVTNSVKLQAVRRKITIITSGIVCFAIFCVVLFTFFIPQYKYKKALDLLDNKEYEKAYTILNEIPKFRDSKNQLLNGKYSQAIDLKNSGSYIEAISIFEELGDYNDSKTQVIDTKYMDGIYQLNSKEYEKAIENFEDVKDYKDAKEYLKTAKYNKGIIFLEQKNYQEAINIFQTIMDYKDSNLYLFEAKYNKAILDFDNYFNNNNNTNVSLNAITNIFETLGNYKDATKYYAYCTAVQAKDVKTSLNIFNTIPRNFKDVNNRIYFLKQVSNLIGKYTDVSERSGNHNYKYSNIEINLESMNENGVCIRIEYKKTESYYSTDYDNVPIYTMDDLESLRRNDIYYSVKTDYKETKITFYSSGYHNICYKNGTLYIEIINLIPSYRK